MSAVLERMRGRVRTANQNAQAGAPVASPRAEHSYIRPRRNFTPYGQAKRVWESTAPRLIFAGPAETGKTLVLCQLLDHICWTYPNITAAIVRKVRADMNSSVIRTWEGVLGLKRGESDAPGGVHKHGGENPEFYQYPNGSRVWIVGLDRPGKVLSGELDIVVVNQTEELEETDWGTLSSRTTGRAGVLRPGRLLGDANPGASIHWIRTFASEGKIEFIESSHRDNPTLYDQETFQLTEQGVLTMTELNALPGVLRDRYYLGLWKSAEGTVWNPFKIIQQPYSEIRRFVAGVDWGFTNPGGFQVWGVDGENRMYRVEEQYYTKIEVVPQVPTNDSWVKRAIAAQERWNIEAWCCDPSEPAFISAFQQAGLNAIGAFNAILPGIQFVESRQKAQEDGLVRIALLAGSRPEPDPILKKAHRPTCFEEEVEVYSYPPGKNGKPNMKENPVDANNHACDMCRYATAYIDNGGGFFFA